VSTPMRTRAKFAAVRTWLTCVTRFPELSNRRLALPAPGRRAGTAPLAAAGQRKALGGGTKPAWTAARSRRPATGGAAHPASSATSRRLAPAAGQSGQSRHRQGALAIE